VNETDGCYVLVSTSKNATRKNVDFQNATQQNVDFQNATRQNVDFQIVAITNKYTLTFVLYPNLK
jgi:uncharacterized protein YjbI with pentapeptide repeats